MFYRSFLYNYCSRSGVREMEIDWAQAWQVGGIGFGLVFVVLAILAVVTWLVSLVLNRNSSGSDEDETKKKE
jgi:hypothetical protein